MNTEITNVAELEKAKLKLSRALNRIKVAEQK